MYNPKVECITDFASPLIYPGFRLCITAYGTGRSGQAESHGIRDALPCTYLLHRGSGCRTGSPWVSSWGWAALPEWEFSDSFCPVPDRR